MPNKVTFKAPTPTISEVTSQACLDVKAAKGYDVKVSTGSAFLRQFFLIVLRMKPIVAVKFLAHCLTHYSRERKGAKK